MAQIIDGKAVAAAVRAEVAEQSKKLKAEKGVEPSLAVVLVGEDPASQIYVRNKKKDCEECGIKSIGFDLPADTKQEILLSLIRELNDDKSIHGILVQLPLPKGLDENEVLVTMSPDKDVDGFHPMTVGRFMTLKSFSEIQNTRVFLPCTPWGCIELLDRYGIDPAGKEAVVVGRSNIVGKPAAILLMSKNATVTVCHSRTQSLPDVVRRADIVLAAIGIPKFIKGDWIKEGAAVIDVGMNRLETGLCGDVDFEAAKERASFITPVPGGVGPMTRAMLMKNTLKAAMLSVQ